MCIRRHPKDNKCCALLVKDEKFIVMPPFLKRKFKNPRISAFCLSFYDLLEVLRVTRNDFHTGGKLLIYVKNIA